MITAEEAKLIQERNRILEQEVQYQKLVIAKLQHRLFGSQSEKVESLVVLAGHGRGTRRTTGLEAIGIARPS